MPHADALAQEKLAQLAERGLARRAETLGERHGAEIALPDRRRLIDFSSNDYLGLATHPLLAEAVRDAAYLGTGAGASRLTSGSLPVHAELERALARYEASEAAVLFNSGYCANIGVLGSLVGPGDAIFSDALNHASLIDGARLSRAEVHVYPHGDIDALAVLLEKSTARNKLIATDSVFSMDGDQAPLPALCGLAERAGAMIVVDEAHATGLFGSRGSGLCEALGVAERVDVRVGTLSKAAGSFGAFAAGSRAVTELLIHTARSYIFTTALPPTVCAASLAALQVLEREPERRTRLWAHIRRFSDGLSALGLPAEPRSPIFPVVLGTPDRALQASKHLRERGVLVKAIRPPTIPEGTSRLRFSLSASHTPEHLDRALDALASLPRSP